MSSPVGAIRPMAPEPPFTMPSSVNHIASSGPATMFSGTLCRSTGNSVISPANVTCPMPQCDPTSVNHALPSAPLAIPNGRVPAGSSNSRMDPPWSISPIPSPPVWLPVSVNHTRPLRPLAIPRGSWNGLGSGKILTLPRRLIRPTASSFGSAKKVSHLVDAIGPGP